MKEKEKLESIKVTLLTQDGVGKTRLVWVPEGTPVSKLATEIRQALEPAVAWDDLLIHFDPPFVDRIHGNTLVFPCSAEGEVGEPEIVDIQQRRHQPLYHPYIRRCNKKFANGEYIVSAIPPIYMPTEDSKIWMAYKYVDAQLVEAIPAFTKAAASGIANEMAWDAAAEGEEVHYNAKDGKYFASMDNGKTCVTSYKEVVVAREPEWKEQLCWTCQNAVPSEDGERGCPWSRALKPVPGWKAIAYSRKENPDGEEDVLYKVFRCPQYLKDGARNAE